MFIFLKFDRRICSGTTSAEGRRGCDCFLLHVFVHFDATCPAILDQKGLRRRGGSEKSTRGCFLCLFSLSLIVAFVQEQLRQKETEVLFYYLIYPWLFLSIQYTCR